MKNLKYIVSILTVAAIAASFSGCTDKNEGSSASSGEVVYYDDENSYVSPEDSQAEAIKNAVVINAELNVKAEIGQSSITASKVVNLGNVQDLNGDTKEGIAVKFEAVNNSENALNLTALGNMEVTVDGDTVESADLTVLGIASKAISDFEVFDKTIAAGESTTGYVSFAANPGWKEIIITYKPFVKSGNYDTAIYKITPDMAEKAE